MSIPKRLIRTVPDHTTVLVEGYWAQAVHLHPDWQHVTLRDPINRKDFPLTSHLWDTCETGAQLADLVRVEELFWRGGVYQDADYLAWKPFDPLLGVQGFAAYEDEKYIPNAVMGFEPGHPALQRVIELAIQRHDQGTWHAGVGVTTEVFKDRTDIAILPPGSFYAVPWRVAHLRHANINIGKIRAANPWAYGLHLYHHSWREEQRCER